MIFCDADEETPVDRARQALADFIAIASFNVNAFCHRPAPPGIPEWKAPNAFERDAFDRRQAAVINVKASSLRQFITGKTANLTSTVDELALDLAKAYERDALEPGRKARLKTALERLEEAFAEARDDQGHSIGADSYGGPHCRDFVANEVVRVLGIGVTPAALADPMLAARVVYESVHRPGTTQRGLQTASKLARGAAQMAEEGTITGPQAELVRGMCAQRGGGRLASDHASHWLVPDWHRVSRDWGEGPDATPESVSTKGFQGGYLDQHRLPTPDATRRRLVDRFAAAHAALPFRPNSDFRIGLEHGFWFHVALQHALLARSLDRPIDYLADGAFAGLAAMDMLDHALQRPAPGHEATGRAAMIAIFADVAFDLHGADRAQSIIDRWLTPTLAAVDASPTGFLTVARARISIAHGVHRRNDVDRLVGRLTRTSQARTALLLESELRAVSK